MLNQSQKLNKRCDSCFQINFGVGDMWSIANDSKTLGHAVDSSVSGIRNQELEVLRLREKFKKLPTYLVFTHATYL